MADTNAPKDVVAELIGSPEKFGMAWGETELHADKQKTTTLGKWPLLELVNVSMFLKTVPNADEIVLGASNGTSLRVAQQAVRNVIRKNRKMTKDDVKRYCVNRILGTRNNGIRGPKVVQIARSVWVTMPKAAQDAVLAANSDAGVKLELTD